MVPVIKLDQDKCVNCHMCIAVCPVKYCIDGSGEKVTINADLCIGCGSCIAACTQHARTVSDDVDAFVEALGRGEKMVAVAAPALVSSYPDTYKRLLGWLKKAGVAACFDVGFGAELTIRSYVEHIRSNKPKLVISQPCPAIVSYIEVYRPDLLPYLAPADSPMLHTIKMIRDYYPEYRGHRILVLSPCAAKRREFDETGVEGYNVTFKSIEALLKSRSVKLSSQAEADFDNPPAERAVLFSTPGGLLRTAMREVPGIESKARKIEGPELIYPYLDGLGASLKRGINPLLVDCLNCSYGCNAGPGTLSEGKSPDDIEGAIEARSAEGERLYGGRHPRSAVAKKRLEKVVASYWRPGQYTRAYVDRSANSRLRIPSEAQLAEIYDAMHKEAEADHLNCAACGYKSCKGMAIAIFNGLNKKENCHLYRNRVIEREKRTVDLSNATLNEEIIRATAMVDGIKSLLARLQDRSNGQFVALQQSAAAVEEMIATLTSASGIASGKRDQIARVADEALRGERDMASTVEAIRSMSARVLGIGEMISVIHEVADNTNLLAMNAAIQAAHAGNAGKGFAVVASEIRKLAETTGGNAVSISASLKGIVEQIQASDSLTTRTGAGIKSISKDVTVMADDMVFLINSLGEISAGGSQVTQGIEELRTMSFEVKDLYGDMARDMAAILAKINEIATISNEAQRTIDSISH